ncbi:MAG: nucleotide-binding universal stress UspA family protein [Arenicella sp.]|jgi:nucleotide-binding universal stress UspA family protein
MIREVLVYTYGEQLHDSTIRAAAVFAAKHNAKLTGLFVKPDVMGYSVAYGNYPLSLADTFYALQSGYCAKIKKNFERIVEQFEIASEWHQTDEYEKKPRPAFYADIIFVSQASKDSSVIFNDSNFIDHLITDTGLPIVIIPRDWSAKNFATLPVLGWKETPEAVNAVRHTLAIMRDAKDVNIVSISPPPDPDEELIEGIEISDYLNRHQITTEYFAENMNQQDHNEADALLRHVDKHGRDLIIIGGYGHSRFREIVLGGMTRRLIKESSVPVLLAH